MDGLLYTVKGPVLHVAVLLRLKNILPPRSQKEMTRLHADVLCLSHVEMCRCKTGGGQMSGAEAVAGGREDCVAVSL